jgi:hypothetical protein
VQLLVLHPEVANRDCGHCQKYLYDEETGALRRQKFGKGPDGLGLPVLRGNVALPCRSKDGCAKGTPEGQRSLSRKNWRALQHYFECKATGMWPDDGMVRRNAGIIEAAFKRAEITRQWQTTRHQLRAETLLHGILQLHAT